MTQVSHSLSGLVRNQAALLILSLLVALVTGVVIFPAVWSGKRTRRTAALDVLDRLLRWRRSSLPAVPRWLDAGRYSPPVLAEPGTA